MITDELILKYRDEQPMATVIAQAVKIHIDQSLVAELRSYRVYNKDNDIKRVTGPEDFDVLLGILDDIQRKKDRVCEIQLNLMSLRNTISRLYKIVFDYLWLKPVVSNLKNEVQRNTFIDLVIPEVAERRDEVTSLVEIAELIVKNLNQTYNIAKEQSVAVQQKMYWRHLTLPDGSKNERA